MSERLRHFVRSQQLNPELISSLFRDADMFKEHPRPRYLEGRILGALFYEQSTRTRWSFESAMLRLGGNYIDTEDAEQFSSAAKGESLEDTIRVLSKYCDIIVIRHKEEGTADMAAELDVVPIINAGDGKGQHPTQALLDIYTINNEIGRLSDFRIAMVGDLASGRTVRSLCYLLGKYKGVKIVFVSPEHLRMGGEIKEYFTRHGVEFSEENDLNRVLPLVDVVYMTRIQKERISLAEYEAARGHYVINEQNLGLLKKDARLMHPLPHVEEINLPLAVERDDPRIAYFRQANNGLYIRMALLRHMLR